MCGRERGAGGGSGSDWGGGDGGGFDRGGGRRQGWRWQGRSPLPPRHGYRAHAIRDMRACAARRCAEVFRGDNCGTHGVHCRDGGVDCCGVHCGLLSAKCPPIAAAPRRDSHACALALPRRRLALAAGSDPPRAPNARTEHAGGGPGPCRRRRCGQARWGWDRQRLAGRAGRAYPTAHSVGVRGLRAGSARLPGHVLRAAAARVCRSSHHEGCADTHEARKSRAVHQRPASIVWQRARRAAERCRHRRARRLLHAAGARRDGV